MTLSRKKIALGISVIGLLVLLNLARWAPEWLRTKNSMVGAPLGWMRLDFPRPLKEADLKVRRDLFVLEPSREAPVFRRRVVQVRPTPVPLPTAVSVDGTVQEAAGGYRLMGVVSKGGSSEALIGRGTQLFQVRAGDDLEGRYKVQSVGENEVYLTENQTGHSLKLGIWDPPRPSGSVRLQADNGGSDHDNN
ncbi:MAG: hypothetical protein ACREL1_03095 [bacterium]